MNRHFWSVLIMTKAHFKFGVVVPFFHLVFIGSLFFVDHLLWVLLAGWLMYYPIHILGYNICYHKLLSHRAFKPKAWFPYVGTFCGLLALHGNPITSALLHRLHHKHSDTDKDPSDRNKGWWYAYLGWVFVYKAPRKDWLIVNDLRRDYAWILKINRLELLVPFATYGLAYLISFEFGTALLFGGLVAFHAPLISNGFLHWIKDGVAQPIDNSFLAKWFNPGAHHATHHRFPGQLDDSANGVRDWSAIIIKRILSK